MSRFLAILIAGCSLLSCMVSGSPVSYCGATDAGQGTVASMAGIFILDEEKGTFQFTESTGTHCTISGTATSFANDATKYALTDTSRNCSLLTITTAKINANSVRKTTISGTIQTPQGYFVEWFMIVSSYYCTNTIPTGLYCGALGNENQYSLSLYTQTPANSIVLSFFIPRPCEMQGTYFASIYNQTAIAWTYSTCNASDVLVQSISMTPAGSSVLSVELSLEGQFQTVSASMDNC